MDEIKWNGLLRQRRALLGVSLVLAFSQLAQISLEKINFLGNEMVVKSPSAINAALWILWGYWLFRFYVYSRDVGAVDITSLHFNSKLNILLRENATALLQHDPTIAVRLKEDKATFTGASCDSIDLYGYSVEGYKIGANQLSVYYAKENGNNGCAQYSEYKTLIPHQHIRPLKRQAARYVVLHTPIATDFWLPYLVAAVPLLIVLVQFAIPFFKSFNYV